MSVSAYSVLFLGFPVQRSDFIVEKAAKVATCPKGHKQTGDDDFCSKDGGKFEKRVTLEPAEALRAIHKFFGYTYEEEADAEENLRHLFEDGQPCCSFEDRRPWGHSGHAAEVYQVAGVRLSQTSSYRGTLGRIDDEALKKARVKVEELRKALGMEDRAIQLYHEVRLS